MLRITLCLIGFIIGSLSQSTDEGLLPDGFTLPPEIQQKINGSEVQEAQKKLKDLFREKCEANGHIETSDNAEASTKQFIDCVKSLVDVEVLKTEIENAKPEGRVDEVFKKYCNKRPEFMQCFETMTDSLKPCFSDREQSNLNKLQNMTKNVGEFVCHKDGERIALFIAEGGQECFEQKRDEVQACVKKYTVGDKNEEQIKEGMFSLINSTLFEFSQKECDQMKSLEGCVIGALEKCEAPTTSNIVESMFKFIRNGTPCVNQTKVDKKPNSSTSLTVQTATVLLAVASLLIV